MRIPFWQSEQAHPTKAIDRLQSHRSFRRMMGIQVREDFGSLVGSIVLVRGTGKHARIKEIESVELGFEDSVKEVFVELLDNESPTESDVQFAASELACYQTNCYRSLLNRSGIHKNDLVAIGATDPGYSYLDFDGNKQICTLTNSTELAKQTSITIIDRFRERDIVDGGNGEKLFALAYWFLFADRDPKIAEEHRLLILQKNSRRICCYLPASDGLDAMLPAIRWEEYSADEYSNEKWLNGVVEKAREIDPALSLRVVMDNEIERQEPLKALCAVSSFDEFGVTASSVDAVSTAFLANAFVDQLPVSIPDLTGNQTPRILGSLTPGSLVNFRQFVMEASKVSPSIMKLRDAV